MCGVQRYPTLEFVKHDSSLGLKRVPVLNALRLTLSRAGRDTSVIDASQSPAGKISGAAAFLFEQARFGAAPTYSSPETNDAIVNIYTSVGRGASRSKVERICRRAAAAIAVLPAAVLLSLIPIVGVLVLVALIVALVKTASARRHSDPGQSAADEEALSAKAGVENARVWMVRDASHASVDELLPLVRILIADAKQSHTGIIFHTESPQVAVALQRLGFTFRYELHTLSHVRVAVLYRPSTTISRFNSPTEPSASQTSGAMAGGAGPEARTAAARTNVRRGRETTGRETGGRSQDRGLEFGLELKRHRAG